ncbi:MAG: UDP-N-acetylmuramoyl-tripeptide--D-alanyl-D-alanine ligase [Gammaproteobacteria bacterium]|nr:MAG: UDP-N-acetylmuramoyl-tripeptide--D-alanyl-D-alanine ligase [Gammaproteobacteria bacterium]RLA61318.1 MAG: UDP-N-acetylmuramoyl-tripeptide--D-alanyl-D-alanine ligase [Gammaproteobacteria bacterium]
MQAPLQARLTGGDREILRVATDSRSLQHGDLFVALRGEHHDGHDYVAQVGGAGAAAALVSHLVDVPLPQLCVTDTRQALGRLGGHNRQLFSGTLVAITGSSGKTTVKNMVWAVLSQQGRTLATHGNFNNEIGVPLTLLRLKPGVDYAVVEMGAARAGDIAWLCELGRPSVALLLNAMPAHLQGFGSIGAVAAAKGEIFDGLGKGDFAVINADQSWAAEWRARAGDATVLDFGLHRPAAIRASNVRCRGVNGISFTALTPAGDSPIHLVLPGEHNVANALAAIAVGLACELSLTQIRDGLASVKPVAGRLLPSKSGAGVTVIDDCYNANPGSVRAAIDVLACCVGRRTLMLGAMEELGDSSEILHREVGEYARAAGIEQLWGVGPKLQATIAAFGGGGRFFADRAAVLASLEGEFTGADTVLIKGSRSAGMEQLLQALLADHRAGED